MADIELVIKISEKIYKYITETHFYISGLRNGTSLLEEILKSIRTGTLLEQKLKKGEWIGEKGYPICSKCNCNIMEEYLSYSDYAEIYKPMKHCPNCGAEMESNE